MKSTFILLIAILSFNCKGLAEPIEDQEKLVEKSEKILSHLTNKDFKATRVDFNDNMKTALSSEHLATVWNGLTSNVGDYKEKGDIITDELQGYRVVYIICKFEKSPFKLKVVFDDEDMVAGLFLIPVNQK